MAARIEKLRREVAQLEARMPRDDMGTHFSHGVGCMSAGQRKQHSKRLDRSIEIGAELHRKREELERLEEAQRQGPIVRERINKAQEARAQMFDALAVGDSLEPFGLCATVTKKNAKSVVTGLGCKYTRHELTGCK